jgi:hypothetical protein
LHDIPHPQHPRIVAYSCSSSVAVGYTTIRHHRNPLQMCSS